MLIFLLVMACAMGYAFIGGLSATRYNAVASRKCRSGPEPHHIQRGSYGSWCGHFCTSLWLMGVAWPIGLPVAGGSLIGNANSVSRTERRREKEIAEANHKVALAKIRAEETEALEKALER